MNQSNYDRFPTLAVKGWKESALSGWEAVSTALSARSKELLLQKGRCIITVDCYPGTDCAELLCGLSPLVPVLTLCSDDCAMPPEALDRRLADTMTDDRVFGIMTAGRLEDCFLPALLANARTQAEAVSQGLVLVYGVGASLVCPGDILVVSDLSRWEIQLRWRAGASNWRSENSAAPILSKYKRGYFAEWRFADRHKKALFSKMDYLLETNRKDNPVMISRENFSLAMEQAAHRPFRTVPYFDPGVWGGQWMKEKFGLDPTTENFAWSFDGVPEENSLLFSFGETVMELPALDLVLTQPRALLGERVHARFGAEFPIRFDLLDTMGGQNLSLQVHPLTEYIQETFHMHYTQDESYYILDAAEDAKVYLGIKTGASPQEMMSALREAEKGGTAFPAAQYVNEISVKKHDHVLIPAGTVHCSGKDTMVLEISATPYIFTFKLWDWGRLGLDGLPRPTHLAHGEKNIQWDRDTRWVEENLIHQEKMLCTEAGCTVERTGLHRREFIDTFRYTLQKSCTVHTGDSVHVLNLVEGSEAVVTSPDGAFEPFAVHYAETFIIPASVGSYCLAPSGETREIKVLMATVQTPSGMPAGE